MKRFIGSIRRSTQATSQTLVRKPSDNLTPDSIEGRAVQEVIAFCETGEADRPGDEFLHLPAIVEAAESSPAAAKAAAHQIHKFLSKPNTSRGVRQYNAVMLIRILTDNPGPTFTRNIDSRFTSSIKFILRDGRDMSVQHILRETLEFLAVNKSGDANLAELLLMWKKEKEKFERNFHLSPVANAPQPTPDYFVRQQREHGLPSVKELASRISEADSSAKLLLQMVQSTPPAEILNNDLLKEFASRCQAAQRSMQSFINSTNPTPDEETMLTLIDTNDKLAMSLSKYQRAVLNARKWLGTPQQQEQQNPQLQQQKQPQSREEARANLPPLDTGDSKRSGKNRFVPRLSLRRKPVQEFVQTNPPAGQPSSSQTNVAATAVPATAPVQATPPMPDGDVSPIGQVSATLFPPPSKNGTTTPGSNRVAPAATYQYNSDDFQIENPFADRFTTASNASTGTDGQASQAHQGENATASTAPQVGNVPTVRGEVGIPGTTFQTYQPQGSK